MLSEQEELIADLRARLSHAEAERDASRNNEAEVMRVLARVEQMRRDARPRLWEEGVDAAFRGAILRQNAEDVKKRNPYRATTPNAEVTP